MPLPIVRHRSRPEFWVGSHSPEAAAAARKQPWRYSELSERRQNRMVERVRRKQWWWHGRRQIDYNKREKRTRKILMHNIGDDRSDTSFQEGICVAPLEPHILVGMEYAGGIRGPYGFHVSLKSPRIFLWSILRMEFQGRILIGWFPGYFLRRKPIHRDACKGLGFQAPSGSAQCRSSQQIDYRSVYEIDQGPGLECSCTSSKISICFSVE